ncbi:MAG: hypothetical protein IJ509_03520 [Bacilli bacterium]|nr:hypothetical protein [Bacilli bacterium]
MRSAKESNFPYSMSTVCYFEVYKDGKVLPIKHKNKCDRPELYEAYKRAKDKITTIYAVWPGNWRSDLFIIDDLKTFINSFDF